MIPPEELNGGFCTLEKSKSNKRVLEISLKVAPDTYQGNNMKKVIFVIVAVTIVALAFVNLNLVLNNESKIDIALTSVFAVAGNENGDNGRCEQRYKIQTDGDWCYCDYSCGSGSETDCAIGWRITHYVQYQGYVIYDESYFWVDCM